jgi:hypothetical protein
MPSSPLSFATTIECLKNVSLTLILTTTLVMEPFQGLLSTQIFSQGFTLRLPMSSRGLRISIMEGKWKIPDHLPPCTHHRLITRDTKAHPAQCKIPHIHCTVNMEPRQTSPMVKPGGQAPTHLLGPLRPPTPFLIILPLPPPTPLVNIMLDPKTQAQQCRQGQKLHINHHRSCGGTLNMNPAHRQVILSLLLSTSHLLDTCSPRVTLLHPPPRRIISRQLGLLPSLITTRLRPNNLPTLRHLVTPTTASRGCMHPRPPANRLISNPLDQWWRRV